MQAVVKEGAAAGGPTGAGGGGGVLVVKISVDSPSRGNPRLVRQLLGLEEAAVVSGEGSHPAAPLRMLPPWRVDFPCNKCAS